MSQAHYTEDMIRYYKKEINQLRSETSLPREKVSTCVQALIDYTEENKKNDFLVTNVAPAGTENPYQEKKKCTIV